jgi:hypothetical protein
MKKILLTLALFTSFATNAHEGFHHYGYRGGCFGCGGWVAPALIGGVIGYELTRTQPVYIEPQPVYVQPSVVQQPPVGYHWQEMIDPSTNLKKIVLVPN